MLNYRQICEDAIKTGEHFGCQLTERPESVLELEALLGAFHEWYARGEWDDQRAWDASVQLGIYLGSNLLQNALFHHGYDWAMIDDNLPVLQSAGRPQFSPIEKVFRRIRIGKEESVSVYCHIVVKMAEDASEQLKQNKK